MDTSERDNRQGGSGKAPDDNVVRLPRDWLGPRQELVPFGPSVRASAPESEPGPLWSADDFWGGDAAASPHDVGSPSGDGITHGRGRRPRRLPRLWRPVSGFRGRLAGTSGARIIIGLAAAAVLVVGLIGAGLRGSPPPKPAAQPLASNQSGFDASIGAALAQQTHRARLAPSTRMKHAFTARRHHAVVHRPRRVSHHRRAVKKTSVSAQPVGFTTTSPSAATASEPPTTSAGSSPPAPAPSSATTGSSAGSSGGSSSSSSQSATGASGTLGPGSSPDS